MMVICIWLGLVTTTQTMMQTQIMMPILKRRWCRSLGGKVGG